MESLKIMDEVNLFRNSRWRSDCPIDNKRISYKRYVDDTFLLFWSEFHVTKFLHYTISKHQNIKFTMEGEENNSLSFLYIKIFCDSGKFQTSGYRKPTFTGFLTNFESFFPYRTNIIFFPPCYIMFLWFAFLLGLFSWNFEIKTIFLK